MAAVDVNVPMWGNRGDRTSNTYLIDVLDGINQKIIEVNQRIDGLRGMEGIYYPDQTETIMWLATGITVVHSYVGELPSDLETRVDNPLKLAFQNGPTEALSQIQTENMTTANTFGAQGLGNATDVGEGPLPYTLSTLTFSDFTGAGDNGAKVEGFDVVFQGLYKSWNDNQVGDPVGFSQYIKDLLDSGQYDHSAYHPVRDFISSVLDATGVWPIIKAIMGKDYITGEDIHSTLQRLIDAGVGIITLVSYILAIPTGGASVGWGTWTREAILAEARMLLVNAIGTGVAVLTTDLGNALGLPPWVTGLLSLATGATVQVVGLKFLVKVTLHGQEYEYWVNQTDTVTTVRAGDRVFTDDDLAFAMNRAPRDEAGRPLDWRTGKPLQDDAILTWDPDHARWVIENPVAETTPGHTSVLDTPGEVRPAGEGSHGGETHLQPAENPSSHVSGAGSGPWFPADAHKAGPTDGVVAQFTEGSCVSASGEMITGGQVTQAELLAEIHDWSNDSELAAALTRSTGQEWRGGGFEPEQAVYLAERGPLVATLRAGDPLGHTVFMTPLGDGRFLVRDPADGGWVYTVDSDWVREFVSGGVFRV